MPDTRTLYTRSLSDNKLHRRRRPPDGSVIWTEVCGRAGVTEIVPEWVVVEADEDAMCEWGCFPRGAESE